MGIKAAARGEGCDMAVWTLAKVEVTKGDVVTRDDGEEFGRGFTPAPCQGRRGRTLRFFSAVTMAMVVVVRTAAVVDVEGGRPGFGRRTRSCRISSMAGAVMRCGRCGRGWGGCLRGVGGDGR